MVYRVANGYIGDASELRAHGLVLKRKLLERGPSCGRTDLDCWARSQRMRYGQTTAQFELQQDLAIEVGSLECRTPGKI